MIVEGGGGIRKSSCFISHSELHIYHSPYATIAAILILAGRYILRTKKFRISKLLCGLIGPLKYAHTHTKN